MCNRKIFAKLHNRATARIASCCVFLMYSLFPMTGAQAQPLNEQEWDEVDQSITRALDWIVSTQERDGSYPTNRFGQPAVTSLCLLAMLSQGELPEGKKYGPSMTAAIDYVLSTQQLSGLLAAEGPRGRTINYNVRHELGQTAAYNHAISGLMLSEAYAMASVEHTKEMQAAIERALKVTLTEQRRPKPRQVDRGGWRYIDYHSNEDADLSVIGWSLMFLRSAKNAGFDVPEEAIDDAVACVRRHFAPQMRRFTYSPGSYSASRAMTGAGILALAHAGLHNTPEAIQGGKSMLTFSFADYNRSRGGLDRYHYSLFQCTQAAYQLGDEYWKQYYPPVFRTLTRSQNPDGSWDRERVHTDGSYGNVYTSALVVLSLSAPNQLLPIYQR